LSHGAAGPAEPRILGAIPKTYPAPLASNPNQQNSSQETAAAGPSQNGKIVVAVVKPYFWFKVLNFVSQMGAGSYLTKINILPPPPAETKKNY